VTGSVRRERDDAALLLAAFVFVPLTWLVLGWSWPLSVSSFDGARVTLPLLADLAAARGDWSVLAYRADWMGGTVVRDTFGAWPVFAWLAALGLSATAILNVATFLLQSLIAFLGVRAAVDLGRLWVPEARWPWTLRLVGVVLVGFAPYLGWRVGYGHQSLIVGGLPFAAALALLAAARAETTSGVLVVAAGLAAGLGLLFTGHQIVLYTLVFGAPVLAGLWLSGGGARLRALAAPGLVLVGAALAALPTLFPVLAYAFGSDSLRALGRTDITYSYLTATAQDWWTSLAWTKAFVPSWREPLLHHETNVPLGPPLLLLALLPWPRLRPLAVGLAASVLLALAFSMNLRPLSDALLLIIPPLRSFRVPTRAFWPFCAVLPVLILVGVAGLADRRRLGPWTWPAAVAVLLAALPAVGVVFAPWYVREALGWALAGTLVVVGRLVGLGRPGTAAALAIVLAGTSLGAFQERLLRFRDGEALRAEVRAVAEGARAAEPALASPLVRLQYGPETDAFGPNSAFAAGLSSLDGHTFPTRRFVALARALRNEPYTPNALLLRFAVHPSARAMFQLYDVRYLLGLGPDAAHPIVTPLAPTAGPAWFGASLAPVGSFAALAEELLGAGEALAARAPEAVWLVGDDTRVAAARLPARLDAACAKASVDDVAASAAGVLAEARVTTAADCPLIFAMNYAEGLRASGIGAGGEARPLTVFPAYGALAGVWVPSGTTAVRVTWESPQLPGAGFVRLLGIALVAVVAVRAMTRAPSTH
jgi:hypothetical protein